MAREWLRVELIGTKDGANVTFTIPSLPSGAYVVLVHNTRVLTEVASAPGATRYTISAATVTLGLAPESNADLWARFSWDIATSGDGGLTSHIAWDGLPRDPVALLQYVRKSFPFSVRIFNKSGDLIEWITNDVSAIQWRYSAVGGCADATIRLRRPFDQFGELAIDYGVEIWREMDTLGVAGATLPATLPVTLGTNLSGSQERRWSGFVRELEPVLDVEEYVELRCSGYSRQMEYIIVPAPDTAWLNQDVAAIARDIVDTYVVPGAQINRTPAFNLMPDTSIVLDSFTFEGSAFQALAVLAELAGNAEWGVRADKEVYFLQRTSAVKQSHVIGDRVQHFRQLDSADDVVTRIYLRGAGGQRYIITHANQEAGFYKDRTMLVNGIADTAAATLWANAYFARYATSQPAGRLVKGETDEWIEGVGHPLGLLRVVGGPVFTQAGDALPAVLPMALGQIYGNYTDERFRINSITYTPTDTALSIDIDLGERSNHLADYLRRIEYRLGELQQGLVL